MQTAEQCGDAPQDTTTKTARSPATEERTRTVDRRPSRTPLHQGVLSMDPGTVHFGSSGITLKADNLYVSHEGLTNFFEFCKIEDSKNHKNTSLSELHDIVNYAIRKMFPPSYLREHRVRRITIEQQPGGKKGKSSSSKKIHGVANIVYEYFRGLWRNLRRGELSLESVSFVGAATKYDKHWLSHFGLRLPKGTSERDAYLNRKSTSVKLAPRLKRHYGVAHDLSTRVPMDKTDDVDDAFLLAMRAAIEAFKLPVIDESTPAPALETYADLLARETAPKERKRRKRKAETEEKPPKPRKEQKRKKAVAPEDPGFVSLVDMFRQKRKPDGEILAKGPSVKKRKIVSELVD